MTVKSLKVNTSIQELFKSAKKNLSQKVWMFNCLVSYKIQYIIFILLIIYFVYTTIDIKYSIVFDFKSLK